KGAGRRGREAHPGTSMAGTAPRKEPVPAGRGGPGHERGDAASAHGCLRRRRAGDCAAPGAPLAAVEDVGVRGGPHGPAACHGLMRGTTLSYVPGAALAGFALLAVSLLIIEVVRTFRPDVDPVFLAVMVAGAIVFVLLVTRPTMLLLFTTVACLV